MATKKKATAKKAPAKKAPVKKKVVKAATEVKVGFVSKLSNGLKSLNPFKKK